MYHILFICILLIVNNTTVNIQMHISFQLSAFAFFRKISRCRIDGSYGSSIFQFFEESLYCFPQ